MDHQFPIVATLPDGSERKPLRMTVGIDRDGNPAPRTILWAWSAATQRGFPLIDVAAEPRPVGGRPDRWVLEVEGVDMPLARRRSASCCGDPMKRWRPPFPGAQRSETVTTER